MKRTIKVLVLLASLVSFSTQAQITTLGFKGTSAKTVSEYTSSLDIQEPFKTQSSQNVGQDLLLKYGNTVYNSSVATNYLIYRYGSDLNIDLSNKPRLYLDKEGFYARDITKCARHGWLFFRTFNVTKATVGNLNVSAVSSISSKIMNNSFSDNGTNIISPYITLKTSEINDNTVNTILLPINTYIQQAQQHKTLHNLWQNCNLLQFDESSFSANDQFWRDANRDQVITIKIDNPVFNSVTSNVCVYSSDIYLFDHLKTIDANGWTFSCPTNPSVISGNKFLVSKTTVGNTYEVIASKSYSNTTAPVQIKKTFVIQGTPKAIYKNTTAINVCNTTKMIRVSDYIDTLGKYIANYKLGNADSTYITSSSTTIDGRYLGYYYRDYKDNLIIQNPSAKEDLFYAFMVRFSYEGESTYYFQQVQASSIINLNPVKKLATFAFFGTIGNSNTSCGTVSSNLNLTVVSNSLTISAGSALNICEGEKNVLLSNSGESPVGGEWFGNPNIIKSSSTYTLDPSSFKNDTKIYYKINVNGACINVSTRDVLIKKIPQVNIGSDLSYCQGSGVQNLKVLDPLTLNANQKLSWQLISGNQAALSGSTLNPDKLGAGKFLLTAKLETDYTTTKCYFTDSVNVQVADKLISPIVANEFFCSPREVQLAVQSAQPNIEYYWYKSDGTTYITKGSLYTVTAPDLVGKTSLSFKVKSQITSCSSDLTTVTITKRTAPVLKLDTSFVLCEGTKGFIELKGQKLNGATTTLGTWSGLHVSNGVFDLSSNPAPSTYTLNYNYNFYPADITCNVNGTTSLTINPTPVVDAGIGQSFCSNSGMMEIEQNTINTNNLVPTWELPGISGLVKKIGDKYFINTDDPYFLPSSTPYKINMIVKNAKGCVGKDEKEITILQKPNAPIVFNKESCGAGIVKLEVDNIKTGSVYSWYEVTDSTKIVSTKTFYSKNTTTSFDVIIKEKTAAGCESNYANASVIVYNLPKINGFDDLIICKNISSYDLNKDLDISFRKGGIWKASDPNLQGVYSDGKVIIESVLNGLNAKNFSVEFSYTDSNSCVSKKVKSVSIISSVSKNLFTGYDLTYCQNSLPFNIESISKVKGAKYSGGNSGLHAGLFYPELIPIIKTADGEMGKADISLSLDSNGCIYTDMTVLTILPSPVAPQVTITGNKCIGDSLLVEIKKDVATDITDISYTLIDSMGINNINKQNINSFYVPVVSYNYGLTIDLKSINTCSVVKPTTYDIKNNNVKGTIFGSAESILIGEGIGINFENYTVNEVKSYDWTFGSKYKSSEESPYLYYYENDTIDVRLDLISKEGCKSRIEVSKLFNVYGEETVIPDMNLSSGISKEDETIDSKKFSLYPTQSYDYIHFDTELELYSVSVYNAKGVSLISNEYQGNGYINLSTLNSGIYFIKVLTQEKQKTFKVIKL